MKSSYKPDPYPNPDRNPGPRWAFDMKPFINLKKEEDNDKK